MCGRFGVAGGWQEGDSVNQEPGRWLRLCRGRARTLCRRRQLPAQTRTSCFGAWPRTTRGCFFPFVLDSVALGQCKIFNFIHSQKNTTFQFFLFFFLPCTYLCIWQCYKARPANIFFRWQVFMQRLQGASVSDQDTCNSHRQKRKPVMCCPHL